jgi:hypothetical protein
MADRKTGRFASVEAALLYVERHYKPQGIWPGAIAHADGSASLMYDPDQGAAGPRDVTREAAATELGRER